jgi:hypothetical protein
MSDDPLEDGDLRLYVFQLGNGCMDAANEIGLIKEKTGLEIILLSFAEILHQLAAYMPDKKHVIAERSRRQKIRKTK